MMRFGQVLRIDTARADEYRRYHADVWPEILAAMHEAGLSNWTIVLKDDLLFSYYEYAGPPDEYEARMARLAAAPRMREWWDIMESIQIPLPTRKPGEWWASMEPVFRFDG